MSSGRGFPPILTTTVGSYPIPDWLKACPAEQTLLDAVRVVVDVQRQAGIDLPTDGELYRFSLGIPDRRGMVDYFVKKMTGIRTDVGRQEQKDFEAVRKSSSPSEPTGIVIGKIGEGTLDFAGDCMRSISVGGRNLKFTITSPYMLALSLFDGYYKDFCALTMALADVLADQAAGLDCACIQIDEVKLPANPDDAPIALEAINKVLDAVKVKKAVHVCFAEYPGQSIKDAHWKRMLGFLSNLRTDTLMIGISDRPLEDLIGIREVPIEIQLGIGVIDVRNNKIETPDLVAERIENGERVVGPGRIRWIHPDCGLWMLQRSTADRKLASMVKGRDMYLGR